MPEEFRHIVRIAEKDLDGTLRMEYALKNIKGIGIGLASIMVKKAGIKPEARLGFLSDEEIEKIEDIIEKPAKYGLVGWLLNRSKDSQTGNDVHMIGSSLDLQTKMDIDELKKIRCWRGYRHAFGLKVRGQRTRTTGRHGKSMGVRKTAAMRKAGRAT